MKFYKDYRLERIKIMTIMKLALEEYTKNKRVIKMKRLSQLQWILFVTVTVQMASSLKFLKPIGMDKIKYLWSVMV